MMTGYLKKKDLKKKKNQRFFFLFKKKGGGSLIRACSLIRSNTVIGFVLKENVSSFITLDKLVDILDYFH